MISCEIFNESGQCIASMTGEPFHIVPIIGGTFANPDFQTWHSQSEYSCEALRMDCTYENPCNGIRNLIESITSVFFTVVCGARLVDCDGNCVLLECE